MTSDVLDLFLPMTGESRSPASPNWTAQVLGPVAAHALGTEASWEVAAVFRRSFYCRSRSGSLICFGPMSIGSGPLNVLCLIPAPIDRGALPPITGSPAVCYGAFFRVVGRFTISLSGAEVRRPAVPLAAWRAATVIDGLAALAREVRARPQRGGLQILVPFLAGSTASVGEGVCPGSPLIRMAMAGIAPLARWLDARLARPVGPAPIPASAIDALIGLGPGLTPSGDDFLGGVLVALRHLGASSVTESLAAEVLARASQRTNEISRAHLAAAAGGEASAPLHGMLSSLCSPGASGMGEYLSAIDAVGHTSGWDALAGVALAAARVARIRTARRKTCVSV